MTLEKVFKKCQSFDVAHLQLWVIGLIGYELQSS